LSGAPRSFSNLSFNATAPRLNKINPIPMAIFTTLLHRSATSAGIIGGAEEYDFVSISAW
jgi:hypothetical protein